MLKFLYYYCYYYNEIFKFLQKQLRFLRIESSKKALNNEIKNLELNVTDQESNHFQACLENLSVLFLIHYFIFN